MIEILRMRHKICFCLFEMGSGIKDMQCSHQSKIHDVKNDEQGSVIELSSGSFSMMDSRDVEPWYLDSGLTWS